MFDKVLIANRGEIACRVIRTARKLGVQTVAVYSEADANARHVVLADEARLIGPAPARESYLKIEALVSAAQETGAQAVHPGYGFLSENAAFAEACDKVGLVFIGPPASAIRAMGSKSEAKRLMDAAKVPTVPGYHGERQDAATLREAAARIGFPVLIKASAGGGGKGMRVVERLEDLEASVASAKREASSSFGDDRVLLEKYLTRPRHIEIQIFADGHGNAVYLFERDCSIQRRHQKVIEEAPAPGMTANRRREMGEAAIAAARAIGYRNAGTVEFIADEAGAFFFMEMNTRLQVEHPVTEMISGQDLVEWQLRVAAGERLPLDQDRLRINGHAFEARIYAEDPSRDFLPATGRLAHLRFPEDDPNVRIDTGVVEGDAVTIHYDPMIAKLIAWGEDREAARKSFVKALGECEVVGVATNTEFLRAIAAHPAFAAAELDTGFIARHRRDLIPEAKPASARTLALATLSLFLQRTRQAESEARKSDDPYSPWAYTDGWRMNDDNHHIVRLQDGNGEAAVTVHYRRDGYVMDLPDAHLAVRGRLLEDGELEADLGGYRCRARVVRRGRELVVFADRGSHRLLLIDPLAGAAELDAVGGRLAAPMPGKVVEVLVKDGASVKRGAPLLVLEAMKMEHTISAFADGTIEKVIYSAGEQVEEGAELIVFQPARGN
ncbi:MAG TPA: acetyl/propionyl/methylcrotonyl-CoA carboxylase subunit alpha [Alphaproteobacteria bacterium]|nr:acetyl/propionyl/methylcrotonyl-CoA carboxylase subunit alpha [Alphaproteobacteria bacterium]